MNKIELRGIYSHKRKRISSEQKSNYDSRLLNNIISSEILNKFEKILCYVSVKNEPDTRKLIGILLSNGKSVYIPYCQEKNMLFYRLNSPDELIDGAFGIPTVDVSDKIPLKNFDNCACVVPAISFDTKGNRLGYGGGFYDRFLNGKNIFKVGITYEVCLASELPNEDFDVAVDTVITEQKIIRRKL